MEINLYIADADLTDLISEKLSTEISKEMVSRYNGELSSRGGVAKGIEKAIKEVVYSRKDEIIERCVERATAEIVRKSVPKLLDRVQITGVVEAKN